MIDPQIFDAYLALQSRGWRGDKSTLEAAIKKLSFGLPAEDEFSLVLSWLGKCRLVHSLGQEQTPPESDLTYRVPDLLAVFDYEGRTVVALIEVKVTNKPKLSWKKSYNEGILRYGGALGLPVIVAWKLRTLGLWALVDIRCFQLAKKNYNLRFESAMEQNLMGILAGDFGIDFEPGFGMHFEMKKLSEWSNGGLDVRIEEAYFEGAGGTRFAELKGGLWPLLTTMDHEVSVQETETHLHQSFIVLPKSSIQFAHRAFPAILQWPALGEPLHWRQQLRQHRFPTSIGDLRAAAEETANISGVVRRFIRQVPADIPAFLKESEREV